MSDFDDLLSSEEQRARMLGLLRESKLAVITAVNNDGDLITMFFGADRLQLLGLRDKMMDHVDEFESLISQTEFMGDEDDDDSN